MRNAYVPLVLAGVCMICMLCVSGCTPARPPAKKPGASAAVPDGKHAAALPKQAKPFAGAPAAIPATSMGSFNALWNEAKVPWLKDAKHYVVAPDGKAENQGTVESPWDLASVFAAKQQIAPGSAVWVRGGTYGTGGGFEYQVSLAGTAEKPIVVRACPGERATINGGVQQGGSHTWLWGLEVCNTTLDRKFSSAGTNLRPGSNLNGQGSKWINMILHDGGHGAPGFWRGTSPGGEMNGVIAWANGFYDMAPGQGGERGSMYGQNESGMNYIIDTIQFRQFTCGVFCGSSGGGSACSPYTVEGNVCFDNPWWNYLFQTGKKPMTDIRLIGNFAWSRRDDKHKSTAQLQYYGVEGEKLEFRDNYFVMGDGGDREFCVKLWKNITFTGNTLVGSDRLVRYLPASQVGAIKWDNNRYHGGAGTWHGGKKSFVFNTATNFEAWKAATGFDASSSWTTNYPTGVKVFVRPNQYEPGRGHVIVYNWDKKPAVDADVSSILGAGDSFEVRDAQNYFGKPVLEGTCDGKPLAMPMNLTEVAQPVGDVPHIQKRFRHTAPEFAVFVVIKRPNR